MNKVYNWESKMFDQICMFKVIIHPMGFPGGSDGKESTCNAGDLGLIPGSGRSPEEGNGYPFQYFCLENLVDRRAWWRQRVRHG